jgi:putative transposase
MERNEQFSQKKKLAILESAREVGIKEAARLAGVHYTTIYEWRKKLGALGEEAFLAYQPGSRGRGIKRITAEQEKAVLDTWGRYPGFGPSQVRNQLRRQGVTISTRTVQGIMEANGYKAMCKKHRKKGSQRFEATRPLELVQIDILEFFIHKLKVYLILLLDDFSRFIVGWRLRNFSKSPGTLGSYGNKPPGKENRFSSASNALNRWLVRFYMKWLDACVQRFSLPYVAN